MTKSPTVRQRRLGRELRRLREQAKLTPEEAARRLGWSRPKLNRIENARIAVIPLAVADARDLYGVDFSTEAELVQLCKDAAARGWWSACSDVFTGCYIALETEATSVRAWEPILIPCSRARSTLARSSVSPAVWNNLLTGIRSGEI